jgi:hypothetical protein
MQKYPTKSSVRRVRARPLADFTNKLMEPVCRKRGFAIAEVIVHWPEIAGQNFADISVPQTLKWPHREHWDDARSTDPATLTVLVEGFHALRLQHQIPLLRDRINQYFGYRAIDSIRLVQRPIKSFMPPTRRTKPVLRDLSADEQARLDAATSGISNPRLAASVKRLGRGVFAIKKR